MADASAPIASELGPLAQQKAIVLCDEGECLLERLGEQNHNSPAISEKVVQLKLVITEVVQLAKNQIKRGKAKAVKELHAGGEGEEKTTKLSIHVRSFCWNIRVLHSIIINTNNSFFN